MEPQTLEIRSSDKARDLLAEGKGGFKVDMLMFDSISSRLRFLVF